MRREFKCTPERFSNCQNIVPAHIFGSKRNGWKEATDQFPPIFIRLFSKLTLEGRIFNKSVATASAAATAGAATATTARRSARTAAATGTATTTAAATARGRIPRAPATAVVATTWACFRAATAGTRGAVLRRRTARARFGTATGRARGLSFIASRRICLSAWTRRPGLCWWLR